MSAIVSLFPSEWTDTSVLLALKAFALLGIPAGIALGACLGLVARRADGWGGYASWSRRATRLGHVAAVMLPLLAGFYALALTTWGGDPTWAARGGWLWMGGSALLVLVLHGVAWKPRLAPILVVPASAVLVGGVCLAVSMSEAPPETPAAPANIRLGALGHQGHRALAGRLPRVSGSTTPPSRLRLRSARSAPPGHVRHPRGSPAAPLATVEVS